MVRDTNQVGVYNVPHYSRHKDGPCEDFTGGVRGKTEAFVIIFALQWRQNS